MTNTGIPKYFRRYAKNQQYLKKNRIGTHNSDNAYFSKTNDHFKLSEFSNSCLQATKNSRLCQLFVMNHSFLNPIRLKVLVHQTLFFVEVIFQLFCTLL
jgi:hypothetical protein